MDLKKALEPFIAICVLTGMIWGGITYFAKAEDLQMVEMRLDQKIVGDVVSQTQQRIWTLEDRNQGKPCSDWKSEDEKAEYRKLKEQLKMMEEKQKIMMQKGVK